VNAALGLFFFIEVAGVGLCLFLFCIEGGYFFIRAVLKILGLYTPPPEVVCAEIKLLKISGAVVLCAIVCSTIAGFLCDSVTN
jgi:hypothetical protein